MTSTVKYVVSDGKVAAPADHVENATWTRTLTLDKVTGKELSATPWASDKTAYAAVPTPGLTGYYVDKASVASKAVTQETLKKPLLTNHLEAWFQNQKHQMIQTSHQHQM